MTIRCAWTQVCSYGDCSAKTVSYSGLLCSAHRTLAEQWTNDPSMIPRSLNITAITTRDLFESHNLARNRQRCAPKGRKKKA